MFFLHLMKQRSCSSFYIIFFSFHVKQIHRQIPDGFRGTCILPTTIFVRTAWRTHHHHLIGGRHSQTHNNKKTINPNTILHPQHQTFRHNAANTVGGDGVLIFGNINCLVFNIFAIVTGVL